MQSIAFNVCMPVHWFTSKTTSKLHKIFCVLPMAVAWSHSDDNAIHCVLNGFVGDILGAFFKSYQNLTGRVW